MPDVQSIGLGGGSRVRKLDGGRISVGPDSVGHYVRSKIPFQTSHTCTQLLGFFLQLTRDSLVFGGTQLTATDVSVRASGLAVGDPEKVSQLDEEVVKKAHNNVKRLLEVRTPRFSNCCALVYLGGLPFVQNAIDRMKTSPEDCDVLLVGGGSIIAPSALKGVKNIMHVPLHPVSRKYVSSFAQSIQCTEAP